MRVLLLIDLQNDFMPGGALPVSGGDEVVAVANAEMARFDHVVATQDWHPADHGSFASQHAGASVGERVMLGGLPQVAWPDHCIQGSHGADFHPNLDQDGIRHVVQKGIHSNIDSYSGFFDNGRQHATGLETHLKEIGLTDQGELHVLGLATDYCVKFTVLDALSLGYQVFVNLDGCRGVGMNPDDIQTAVKQMADAGAEMLPAPM
ncbi:MAG: bifunctional nicotinamidase/pyrazinamidase [Planctomycetota bacterium]